MPDPSSTVLVVDDNTDHPELLCVAGKRVAPAFSFRVVSDGQEALDYVDGVHPFEDRSQFPYPSLVLLDLMMPRVDGFAVLARLQTHPGAALVPVVVLTTSPDPMDEHRAMGLGANAFHSKPAGLEGFGTLLEEIVGRWVI